jgi:hypothetical protein
LPTRTFRRLTQVKFVENKEEWYMEWGRELAYTQNRVNFGYLIIGKVITVFLLSLKAGQSLQ